MYGRLITILVFVLLGLMATVFAFNWLWAKAFGPGGGPGQHQAQKTREETAEDRKKLKEEHRAKVKENIEKNKHSTETLTKAAQSAVPQPLSASEFDPNTGKVAWPEVLLTDDYKKTRQRLERLLKQRAASPDDSTAQAHAAAEELLDLLKEHIKDLPSNDYIATRKFLESLAHSLKP
ncbi:MAG: hypothetical protein EXS05_02200 [Planctomycetaceae bacterium]|nr:hypothetical protein [Planctomycetaceae bacterium]